MRIKVKVRGEGVVTHRCATCGHLIKPPANPVLIHKDGRLVAIHELEVHQNGSRSAPDK